MAERSVNKPDFEPLGGNGPRTQCQRNGCSVGFFESNWWKHDKVCKFYRCRGERHPTRQCTFTGSLKKREMHERVCPLWQEVRFGPQNAQPAQRAVQPPVPRPVIPDVKPAIANAPPPPQMRIRDVIGNIMLHESDLDWQSLVSALDDLNKNARKPGAKSVPPATVVNLVYRLIVWGLRKTQNERAKRRQPHNNQTLLNMLKDVGEATRHAHYCLDATAAAMVSARPNWEGLHKMDTNDLIKDMIRLRDAFKNHEARVGDPFTGLPSESDSDEDSETESEEEEDEEELEDEHPDCPCSVCQDGKAPHLAFEEAGETGAKPGVKAEEDMDEVESEEESEEEEVDEEDEDDDGSGDEDEDEQSEEDDEEDDEEESEEGAGKEEDELEPTDDAESSNGSCQHSWVPVEEDIKPVIREPAQDVHTMVEKVRVRISDARRVSHGGRPALAPIPAATNDASRRHSTSGGRLAVPHPSDAAAPTSDANPVLSSSNSPGNVFSFDTSGVKTKSTLPTSSAAATDKDGHGPSSSSSLPLMGLKDKPLVATDFVRRLVDSTLAGDEEIRSGQPAHTNLTKVFRDGKNGVLGKRRATRGGNDEENKPKKGRHGLGS